MAGRFHVATRKGLFTYTGGGRDWSIERASFVGDPVSIVLEDRRDGALYAAMNLGHFGVKLRRSDDGGASWSEIGVPAFPAVDGEEGGPSLKQIWALEPGGASQPGRLWCGTIPGALFRSDDRGESWSLVESLWERPEREQWFGGGYDEPGIHSICVDPRDADTLRVAVSCGGAWTSTDAGASWALEADGMLADYMPPDRRADPTIQDPHRMVQSPSSPDRLWVQHHNGVFRSDDASKSWVPVEAIRPAGFGFAVAVHPSDPDTAWFVPGVKDECRVPVDGKLVVARTRDGGASFELQREGLPDDHAYDLVFRHALDVDGDGRVLAFGSTTGNLWVSDDGGERWHTLSTHLPPIYQVRFA